MNTRQIAEMVGNLVRHQHHFEAMSTEDGQWVARNCETAIGLFIEAVKNRNNNQEQPETEVELPALLSVVVTTHLAAVAEKKTAKCFVGPLWYKHGRDSDFDRWLQNQPYADACDITTLALSRDWKFTQSAAGILGVPVETPVKTLGELLIEGGHTMALAQAEEMSAKTERGEKTGLRTDGWGNFFFTETGDPNDPVSVGHVGRYSDGWCATVSRLDYDSLWRPGPCLLVRNLDPSTL